MNKVKIRLKSAGVRSILRSKAVQSECYHQAAAIAGRADGNYKALYRSYPERSGAVVHPADAKTARENAETNALLKARG